jgi:hypothetical protein
MMGRQHLVSFQALSLVAIGILSVAGCERSRQEQPDASVSDGGGPGHDMAGGAVIPNVAEPFIALAGDFANFQSWYTVEVAHSDNPITGAHGAGPRRIYLNTGWPFPPGTSKFPVGTILIKTAGETKTPDDPSKWEIHAMVKRGGTGWNSDGAVGWEWFDLGFASDGQLVINWRGLRPPMAGGYTCALLPGQPIDPNAGDCNGCHAAPGMVNDFVIASPLMFDADADGGAPVRDGGTTDAGSTDASMPDMRAGCVADEAGCQACLEANCSSEMTYCFGADWVADSACAYSTCPVLGGLNAVGGYTNASLCTRDHCADPCMKVMASPTP